MRVIKKTKNMQNYLYVAPTVIFIILIVIFPLIYSLGVSFTNTRLGRLPAFIGLANMAWLAEPKLAIPAIIGVDVWQMTPFVVLVLLAGLQAIPLRIEEAARVDGANSWQIFKFINLSLIKKALIAVFLLRLIDVADYEISQALIGVKTPKEALDAAAKKWNDISEEYGLEKQKRLWLIQYNQMKKMGIAFNPLED